MNLDVVARAPGVRVHDLRRGLPFPDASFDLVYHSHVLEHLSPDEGRRLLRECHRVLLPGGVLRVAVPDLEAMVRLYLDALGAVRAGAEGSRFRREWMLVEMYDQATRDATGGLAAEMCRAATRSQRAFIESRWGEEARGLFESAPDAGAGMSMARALGVVAYPSLWGRWFRRWVGGTAYRAGEFRDSGELHKWMYDSVGLESGLFEAGFAEVRRVAAAESRVPEWACFLLDTDERGRSRKPDSLYMEAIRPSNREACVPR